MILSLFIEANSKTTHRTISQDEFIIRAIFYDEYALYENSYIVYKKLFDETGEYIFLLKEAQSALWSQKFILESIERLSVWDKKYPNNIEIKRLLIPLYLTVRQVKNAKKEAILLLSLSKEVLDFDLSSSAFLYSGDFKRALSLLNKAYLIEGRESILLRMVDIMDEFGNERIQAIALLEKHNRMNTVSKKLHEKLILLYEKEKNILGILSTYLSMYEAEAKEEYFDKILDAYFHLKDIKGATLFLEKYKKEPKVLYELYKMQEKYDKAIAMIDRLYQEDKNAKWIAEKGVLLFESAKDKDDKGMIKNVLSYLEKAITLGNDDSLYLNYYGYTLIDKEVDIPKGIKIIEDALLQQPNNTYYLDSLAWGYYKENKCSEAYTLMKRVVEEEGLEEEEISMHWDAIRDCQ